MSPHTPDIIQIFAQEAVDPQLRDYFSNFAGGTEILCYLRVTAASKKTNTVKTVFIHCDFQHVGETSNTGMTSGSSTDKV